MNIRMYNCYFGDCFKLNNETGTPLLVDFGIHEKRVNKTLVSQRFNDVYQDIQAQELDFLLSHYHEDHYNGAVHIKNNYGYTFKDVYIPDIWTINGSIAATQLTVLSSMLSMYKLNNNLSILTFLQRISKSNIHFVQRGYTIQDKYIALWPSYNSLSKKAEKVLERVLGKGSFKDDHIVELTKLSSDISQTFKEYKGRDIGSDSFNNQLSSYNDRLRRLTNQMINDDIANTLYVDLHNFGNDISIVFQNKEVSDEYNLLFTGDFGRLKRDWRFIESNQDNNKDCAMHDHYNVIKVGHHGTRPYYHSYASRINDQSVLMIPNGDSKNSWKICSDYSINAFTTGSKVICSTGWSCEVLSNNRMGNCSKCPCTNNFVIENATNKVYVDIP